MHVALVHGSITPEKFGKTQWKIPKLNFMEYRELFSDYTYAWVQQIGLHIGFACSFPQLAEAGARR